MVTIISTHPVTTRYIKWERDDAAHSKRAVWDCTIKGGAGIALGKGELVVHDGIATEIDEKALEILRTIPSFVEDEKAGFIKVLEGTRARTVDADEEALKDMKTDGSGKQITSTELENDGAEINEDGSVDVTKGGKNAIAKRGVKTIERHETVASTKKPTDSKRGRK